MQVLQRLAGLLPMKQEFYVEHEGILLHMKLDLPDERKEYYPLLLLIHGFTGHMEERHLLGVRDTAVEEGYACLRAELYGHGESGGSFADHDLNKWLAEVVFIIDQLKAVSWIDKLILSGHSQGGLLCVLAAGKRPEALDALMPLSPAVNIPDFARSGNFLGNHFDPDDPPEVMGVWDDGILKSNYFFVAKDIYPEEYIPLYHGPVLIVHGNADETIDVAVGRRTADLYENCTFVEVNDDTHCFDRHLENCLLAVRSFLKEQTTK